MMLRAWIGWMAIAASAAVMVAAIVPEVRAQDAHDSPDTEAPQPVPAVTLGFEGEPAPEPEPEGPPILEGVGWSYRDREDGNDEEAEPLPDDIPFVVPGDLRTRSVEHGRLALPGLDESPTHPPPFLVSLGAGFTRQLNQDPVHYFRLQQRFEARVPGLDMLRLGAGAAQMIGDHFLFEGGARIGLGAGFCDEPGIYCEGVVAVQPGIALGDFGTFFALDADLDIRVVFDRLLLISAGASLSFIGEAVFVHAALNGGLTF